MEGVSGSEVPELYLVKFLILGNIIKQFAGRFKSGIITGTLCTILASADFIISRI